MGKIVISELLQLQFCLNGCNGSVWTVVTAQFSSINSGASTFFQHNKNAKLILTSLPSTLLLNSCENLRQIFCPNFIFTRFNFWSGCGHIHAQPKLLPNRQNGYVRTVTIVERLSLGLTTTCSLQFLKWVRVRVRVRARTCPTRSGYPMGKTVMFESLQPQFYLHGSWIVTTILFELLQLLDFPL